MMKQCDLNIAWRLHKAEPQDRDALMEKLLPTAKRRKTGALVCLGSVGLKRRLRIVNKVRSWDKERQGQTNDTNAT